MKTDPSEVNKKAYAKSLTVDDSKNQKNNVLLDARILLQQAGITKRINFDMEDVAKVQDHLTGEYQLIVYGEDYDIDPIFKGIVICFLP